MVKLKNEKLSKWWSRRRAGFWRNWIDLFIIVIPRLYKPIGHPAFVIYFLVIILLIGGLGVLLSLYDGYRASTLMTNTVLPRALATYLLAILATAFVDLNLSVEADGKRSLKMFAFMISFLGAFGGVIALRISHVQWAYIAALVGTGLALLLWWVANAENVRLLEPTPAPTDSLGGSTEVAPNSSSLPGTLDGMKS